MKKQILKKAMSLVVALIIVSMLATSAFAANTQEKTGLANWLKNIDNTEFDFSDTSYLDTDICWTVFALSKSGDTDSYPQFEAYINSVVETGFNSLYPSNLALIYMTALERGMDVSSIGTHNITNALKNIDYSSQIYLSSLTYPLLALNYINIDGCDTIKNTIITTILSTQQADGGFPYCSVDTGYGVYSDIDTTSMTVQALAEYYNGNAQVKVAVDKALSYMQTQKFDDGAYGYKAYDSKSADSTAQAVIALCSLNINPDTSISALNSFINTSGAAVDYAGNANTMSSYQTLLALAQYDNYTSGKSSVYKLTEKEIITTTSTEKVTEPVEIPKTGGSSYVSVAVAIFTLSTAGVYAFKKKNEED